MSKHVKTIQNIKTCINVLLMPVYSSLSQQASLQKKNKVQLAGACFKSLSTLSERCPIHQSSWHQLVSTYAFWDSYPRHVEKIKCLCPCFIQATSLKRVGALLIRGGKCCEVQVSNCEWSFWSTYCWWEKSCTTLDGWNPIKSGINMDKPSINWCRISSIDSSSLVFVWLAGWCFWMLLVFSKGLSGHICLHCHKWCGFAFQHPDKSQRQDST